MKVRKRKGEIENFNYLKIAKAIYKARLDAGQNQDLEYCVNEAKTIADSLPNGGKI